MAVLSMSKQEVAWLDVLLRVQSGRPSIDAPAALMGIGGRQIFRLCWALEASAASGYFPQARPAQ